MRLPDVECRFVEFSSNEQKYPWRAERLAIADALQTITDTPHEQFPVARLKREVEAVLDDISPEVVAIAGYSEAGMRAAASWAKRHNRAIVMMGDSTERDLPRTWYREWIKWAWISRHADTAFVAGTRAKQYLEKLGVAGDKIWLGYDVVDNTYFAEEVAKIRAAESRASAPHFLVVCRHVPEKNLSRFLEGYAKYRATAPAPWGLVLAGDGVLNANLKAQAEALGLHDICWPGFVYVNDLPRLYAAASAFVLPSTQEPWGLVVNEAMAAGLPVLVSDYCGSAPDLVRDGENGFIFDPVSADAIAAALERMSAIPRERRDEMGRCSQAIISGYTPETWAANLRDAMMAAHRMRSRSNSE